MGDFINNEFELAWAAGFFDGEGSIFLDSNGYANISISQAILSPLERFRKAMGSGKIYGPHFSKEKTPIYKYSVTSYYDVIIVVANIYIYLSRPKQIQIDNMLSIARMPIKRVRNLEGKLVELCSFT